MRTTGNYQYLGDVPYFIPFPLPPKDPLFLMDTTMILLYGEASFGLGQLNEMCQRLPDFNRFITTYVNREALLSSAIEGIDTTLMEVYTQPLSGTKPNKATQLVLNYHDAVTLAWKMIKDQNLPLISRVLLAAHEKLMSLGQAESSSPGEFRKQSVRVGNLVPPPAPEIAQLMSNLEKFINLDTSIPPLIKAGLAHVMFEIIHPFLDGNGRIGRLLIVLMLIDSGLLDLPILYPSYYFKKHHAEYYERLDAVKTSGDYEGWITFYLKAIKESSADAYVRAKEIELLTHSVKDLIQTSPNFIKMRHTAQKAINIFFQYPVFGIVNLSKKMGKSYNACQKIIAELCSVGLLIESTEHKRNKLYPSIVT